MAATAGGVPSDSLEAKYEARARFPLRKGPGVYLYQAGASAIDTAAKNVAVVVYKCRERACLESYTQSSAGIQLNATPE